MSLLNVLYMGRKVVFMIVNKINIQDIKPYKNNAKKHDETQIKNVAESIKQFGFVQPIVLDKNNEIVIGHCRYEASKLLGLEEVPCVRVILNGLIFQEKAITGVTTTVEDNGIWLMIHY